MNYDEQQPQSPDWWVLRPMANEGERLKTLEVQFAGLENDFKLTRKDHEMRLRSVEASIWKAVGVFSFINCSLFVAALLFAIRHVESK